MEMEIDILEIIFTIFVVMMGFFLIWLLFIQGKRIIQGKEKYEAEKSRVYLKNDNNVYIGVIGSHEAFRKFKEKHYIANDNVFKLLDLDTIPQNLHGRQFSNIIWLEGWEKCDKLTLDVVHEIMGRTLPYSYEDGAYRTNRFPPMVEIERYEGDS